jgi:4,5-dihydroxyphthalate decarboxylase
VETLSVAIAKNPWTEPLIDGEVTVEGFDLEFVPATRPMSPLFMRMARHQEFDVSEMAWSTYLIAKELAKPFTAIPYFPWRNWPHALLTVNRNSGIQVPKDLEGKRLAVVSYTFTPAVFARGLLSHDFGVDVDKIEYVVSSEEHLAEFELPRNVTQMIGTDLGALVASGEIPAAIGVAPANGGDVVPLFANPKSLQEVWRTRELIPINHVIVIKDELLARSPDFARNIFAAFVEARELFLGRKAADDAAKSVAETPAGTTAPGPQSAGATALTTFAGGASGVDANRTVLEASVEFAVEQHILKRPITLDEMFVSVS